MKLVAEQIEVLRKRKQELLQRIEEYQKHCQTRESVGLDGIGAPHFQDLEMDLANHSERSELNQIDELLKTSEFLVDRNFEVIDIGTAFYIDFGHGDKERTMLVDEGTGIYRKAEITPTVTSDFGRAVRGKTEGETISYQVKATGRMVSVTIGEIDRIQKNYTHFIKEKEYASRISKPVKVEHGRLKKEDEEEYRRRHAITPSQVEMLKEELSKIKDSSKDPKQKSRKAIILKLLAENNIAPSPTGTKVEVGSIVEFMLKEEGQDPTFHQVEFINQAVSTETDGMYVERISPLGAALYGLESEETFEVKRKHLPSIKGMVTRVINAEEKRRAR